MELRPINYKEACKFIELYHRHHKPPQGYKFAISVNEDEKIIGVIVVGRPVSRMLDNGITAEVTRCCVIEGYKNACSMLYSAAWRAARAMGYKRMITYTLQSEQGTSLVASGWKLMGPAGGGSWNSSSRPRTDKHPIEQKNIWEVTVSERKN